MPTERGRSAFSQKAANTRGSRGNWSLKNKSEKLRSKFLATRATRHLTFPGHDVSKFMMSCMLMIKTEY